MKNHYCFFICISMVMLSLSAFGQSGYIAWPAREDTIIVPPNTNLRDFIVKDTAGTLWQGSGATTKWQNGTRVYVLRANERYTWGPQLALAVANRKLFIRGEYGKNYLVPSTLTSDWKPRIVGSPNVSGFLSLEAANLVVSLKNLALAPYDALAEPTNLDNVNANLLSVQNSGSASLYADSCIFSTYTLVFQTFGRIYTFRCQNSISVDHGTQAKNDLGGCRFFDGRQAEIDTLDFYNNTISNVTDRTIRRYNSNFPLHYFRFDHNTVMNCMSYHGFLYMGWVDSTGTFKITNNLFSDISYCGPDTDATRQAEFVYNTENDVNGKSKMAWIIAKRGAPVKWTIANNYYFISDSGKAVRNFVTPLHTVYPATTEPWLTSEITSDLTANGGNASTAFRQLTKLSFTKTPPPMTKMAKWYFSPGAVGYLPTTFAVDSAVGAGAGKIKNNASPVLYFAKLPQFVTKYNAFNRYPYDYHRMRLDSVADYFDASFKANVDLATAGSDGKIIGSTLWSFKGTLTGVESAPGPIPATFALSQNYPNPFNPTTTLEYSISKSSNVILEVFNVLGQSVAMLVDEHLVPGTYRTAFDASKLSSGVYLYRLKAGDFVQTRKMVLMK